MADNVTTQIESKTRVSRHINLSSLYFIVGYLMFAYMLKDFIYSLFFVRHPSQHMEKSGGTVGGHTPHRLPETQKEFLFQGVTISYPSTKRRLLPSLFYLTWKGVSL